MLAVRILYKTLWDFTPPGTFNIHWSIQLRRWNGFNISSKMGLDFQWLRGLITELNFQRIPQKKTPVNVANLKWKQKVWEIFSTFPHGGEVWSGTYFRWELKSIVGIWRIINFTQSMSVNHHLRRWWRQVVSNHSKSIWMGIGIVEHYGPSAGKWITITKAFISLSLYIYH